MTGADRLVTALTSSTPGAALRELDDRRELTRLIPELEEGRAFVQPELHYFDVLNHNLAAVDAVDEALDGPGGDELRQSLPWLDVNDALDMAIEGLPLRAALRLACLLHDVAKPRTAIELEGRLRFPRHGPTGADLIRERLPAAGFGPGVTDFVARLVRQHLRPAELVRNRPPSDKAVQKFTADVDGYVLPLMLLNLADGWATRGPTYTRHNFSRHCTFVNYVVSVCAGVHEDRAGQHGPDRPASG